jgi:hypothetical protein
MSMHITEPYVCIATNLHHEPGCGMLHMSISNVMCYILASFRLVYADALMMPNCMPKFVGVKKDCNIVYYFSYTHVVGFVNEKFKESRQNK